MTRLEDRRILLRDIAQARSDGARLASACALVGLDPRTLQRWTIGEGVCAAIAGQRLIILFPHTL